MGIFIVLIAQAILCACLAGVVAKEKGHPEPSTWAIAGFFFSVIGLLAAVGLPDYKLRAPSAPPAHLIPVAEQPQGDPWQCACGRKCAAAEPTCRWCGRPRQATAQGL